MKFPKILFQIRHNLIDSKFILKNFQKLLNCIKIFLSHLLQILQKIILLSYEIFSILKFYRDFLRVSLISFRDFFEIPQNFLEILHKTR